MTTWKCTGRITRPSSQHHCNTMLHICSFLESKAVKKKCSKFEPFCCVFNLFFIFFAAGCQPSAPFPLAIEAHNITLSWEPLDHPDVVYMPQWTGPSLSGVWTWKEVCIKHFSWYAMHSCDLHAILQGKESHYRSVTQTLVFLHASIKMFTRNFLFVCWLFVCTHGTP